MQAYCLTSAYEEDYKYTYSTEGLSAPFWASFFQTLAFRQCAQDSVFQGHRLWLPPWAALTIRILLVPTANTK